MDLWLPWSNALLLYCKFMLALIKEYPNQVLSKYKSIEPISMDSGRYAELRVVL